MFALPFEKTSGEKLKKCEKREEKNLIFFFKVFGNVKQNPIFALAFGTRFPQALEKSRGKFFEVL
jgi:hypothetical protein